MMWLAVNLGLSDHCVHLVSILSGRVVLDFDGSVWLMYWTCIFVGFGDEKENQTITCLAWKITRLAGNYALFAPPTLY